MRYYAIGDMEIRIPTSGGKAGKGRAKTSSIQVLKDNLIVKLFRFTIGEDGARMAALRKAGDYVIEHAKENQIP